jgi:hypothetical protein
MWQKRLNKRLSGWLKRLLLSASGMLLRGTAGLFISSLTPRQGFVLSAFHQAKVRNEPFSELGT